MSEILRDAQRRLEERREAMQPLPEPPIAPNVAEVLREIEQRPATAEKCPRCGSIIPLRTLRDGLCSECRARPERRREEIARALRVQVPPRHRGALSIDLRPEVVEWTGDPWCVVFLGPNGRGKTWAATRLARAVLEALGCSDFAWVSVLQLVVDLRRAVSTDEDLLRPLASRWVLVLDDLLGMRETEFTLDVLRYLVSVRYDTMLPTIVTLDRPLSDLEPRLASRLGEGIVVACRGADQRRRA